MTQHSTDPRTRTQKLLAERQAQVLSWALLARLVFLSLVAVLNALQALALIPPGVLGQGRSDSVSMLLITAVTSIAAALLYRQASRRKHLAGVGLGSVAIDIIVLAIVPFVWLSTVPGLADFPAGMVKGELFTIALLLNTINSITLVPLYPALMTGGSLVVLGAVAYYGLTYPGVQFTDFYTVHFSTEAFNLGILYIRGIVIVLSGTFLSALAYTARKTIREVVTLEVDNLELKERQTEMAFEGRMAALDGMVAGIAHEINTPLGAIRSSVDTASAAARKLVPAENAASPQTQRTLQLVNDVTDSAREGLDRISGLVESLRDFSRIDEADVQHADIRTELDTVLSLIDADSIGNVEIHKDYNTVPQIECRPRELNQAFLTILVNAFEAMAGEGRLSVSTTQVDGDIRITIADSGPGIPSELRKNLFDLNFSQKGKRVGMGLGLPTSRRIVERHGGTLSINDATEQGAQFTISLPVR